MKTKTKQTTRTGTESEKWTSTWRDFSREGKGKHGGVQGRSSIISRHKIDGDRSKWYRKQRTQRTYMHNPWT